jgi:hypothetical protein
MGRRFDPRVFKDRTIVMDTNSNLPVELMNCLGCGKLVSRLYKYDELCRDCYAKWEKQFRERWLRDRFG